MGKVEKDLIIIEKKSFKHDTRDLLKKKKLVQMLLGFSEIKISQAVMSYSGTIIFDRKVDFKNVWLGVIDSVYEVKKLFNGYANCCDILISIEVHRNKKNAVKNNTLLGRPHLHFVVSFANGEVLGPDIGSLRLDLNKKFFDVNIECIKSKPAHLLRTYRYILKESDIKDTWKAMNMVFEEPYLAFWFGFSSLMIEELSNLKEFFDAEKGIKMFWEFSLNKYCFHVDGGSKSSSFIYRLISQYMELNNHILLANDKVLTKVEGLTYSYELLSSWEDYIKVLPKKLTFNYPKLQAMFEHVFISKKNISVFLPYYDYDYDYIEFLDGLYEMKTGVFTESKNLVGFEYKVVRAYSTLTFEECKKASPSVDDLFINNNLDVNLVKSHLGSYFHEVDYSGQHFTTVLYGKSGSGKSSIASVIKKYFGSENIGNATNNRGFALQDCVNKKILVFEEFDIDNVHLNEFKRLTEGDSVFVDRKGKSGIELNKLRVLITSQHNLCGSIYRKEDREALERRLFHIEFKNIVDPGFIDKMKKNPAKVWYELNELYLASKKKG